MTDPGDKTATADSDVENAEGIVPSHGVTACGRSTGSGYFDDFETDLIQARPISVVEHLQACKHQLQICKTTTSFLKCKDVLEMLRKKRLSLCGGKCPNHIENTVSMIPVPS